MPLKNRDDIFGRTQDGFVIFHGLVRPSRRLEPRKPGAHRQGSANSGLHGHASQAFQLTLT